MEGRGKTDAAPGSGGGWNAALYEAGHAFVWQRGEDLLPLLAPQAGERVLDLGCGTGHLTARIAATGAEVVGLDHSPEMVAQARRNYPEFRFELGDAARFRFEPPFDAVFSNAALHWVREAGQVAACIREALRPGGRLVAEFGGQGNIRRVIQAVRATMARTGHARFEDLDPWYFPSIGEYASLLDREGLRVTFALLFDRPTPLEGEEGMRNWLEMFAGRFFDGLPPEERGRALSATIERLRPSLHRDGVWAVDYVRLRVAALRPEE